jgi:membrane-bound ClpP family serine protease
MRIFDSHIRDSLNERLKKLEDHFSSDIISFYGPIGPPIDKIFRDFIEKLKSEFRDKNRVTIFLTTPGGIAETVEKLVDIIRFHYQEVFFVVPDYAMSAGTIFCMSGNKIFMDYSSSLGPIDPQVFTGKDYVSALGYLDQVEKMIKRSASGELTDAELVMLQALDLAQLSAYEQAKNLTITLLKKWLVQYKFANWDIHQTNPKKLGSPVTLKEKGKRAEEIARKLSDNKLWHSHGRNIGINTLTGLLKLKIDDYSDNTKLRTMIRDYHDFLVDFVQRQDFPIFLHSKNYF